MRDHSQQGFINDVYKSMTDRIWMDVQLIQSESNLFQKLTIRSILFHDLTYLSQQLNVLETTCSPTEGFVKRVTNT